MDFLDANCWSWPTSWADERGLQVDTSLRGFLIRRSSASTNIELDDVELKIKGFEANPASEILSLSDHCPGRTVHVGNS